MPIDLFEQWLPPRPTLRAALGIWLAAFALAGATAWRMHHVTVGTEETIGSAVPIAVTPTEAVTDAADPNGAVFMPEDSIVGLRTPRVGVTASQKP
jgi:hypothetical protein